MDIQWKPKIIQEKQAIFQNLNHRIEAENRYKMDRNFSAVCFIEFMAEKWGTMYFENIQAESDDQNFVQQVNEEPIQTNTDICVMCKNPQNGTNCSFSGRGQFLQSFCMSTREYVISLVASPVVI